MNNSMSERNITKGDKKYSKYCQNFLPLIPPPIRAGHTDFGMGGERSPPIGGGPKGGDKGPMGGDWRVIRDKINGTKKSSLNL